MNPENSKTPREEMETWLTALLLGELSAGEAAAVRELIKHDSELAKLHERLQKAIALVREGDFHQPSGFRHTCDLLQLDAPPTAIIASNDMMAFGAMDAAREAGLHIGQDISIIGFDDIYMASQTYPPLTTVRQPLAEMGAVALDMLVMLIQGRKVLNLQRELPTELMVRATTGRVPLNQTVPMLNF